MPRGEYFSSQGKVEQVDASAESKADKIAELKDMIRQTEAWSVYRDANYELGRELGLVFDTTLPDGSRLLTRPVSAGGSHLPKEKWENPYVMSLMGPDISEGSERFRFGGAFFTEGKSEETIGKIRTIAGGAHEKTVEMLQEGVPFQKIKHFLRDLEDVVSP